MNIIEQLEQTVTPAILGAHIDESTNVAAISLLEQFYALLITRLAIPAVYTKLLRADQVLTESTVANGTLFEQVWQDSYHRQLLIGELAMTHHIDEATTEQWLTNAAYLSYQALKIHANGEFLPAFLQHQQAIVRPYLPMWAASVITPTAIAAAPISDTSNQHTPSSLINNNAVDVSFVKTSTNTIDEPTVVTDAIHANPAEHYAFNLSSSPKKVKAATSIGRLLVPILLLLLIFMAMALLWFLVIQPKYMSPDAPIETAPVAVIPEMVVPTLPVELIVSVDDRGELYNCSAIVGDANLQNALSQALRVSFGEQENLCNLETKAGVVTTLANINIEVLPDVFNLLRATPFARLQLQNDSIILESPDDVLLQRLLIDIRQLLPTISITAVAPIPIPDNNEPMVEDSLAAINGRDDDFSEDFVPEVSASIDNQNLNNPVQQVPEYQPADDNNDDNLVMPPVNNTAPAGPISLSELNNLSGTDFVSEPLHNARPVDRDIGE